MPPKRRIIDVDAGDDSDIVEMQRPPPTILHLRKKSTSMPSALHSNPGSNAPGPTPVVGTQPLPNHFFTYNVGMSPTVQPFFPDRTLAILAELHRLEVQTVMHAYESNMPATPSYEYSIVSDAAVGSATDFSSSPVGPSTPSLSHANACLLHHFLARNPRLAAMKERPKFILLGAIKGVKNPRFAHLHAVRYDEVGCGFDEDDCLSLLLTELVDGERHTNVLYVEKVEVAVGRKAGVPNAVERVKVEGG